MPSHPELVTIQHGEGLTSALVAVNDMEAGFKVPLSGLTHGEKRYTTVQCSETEHFELNSDFVYMNHSCEPSCELIVDEGTYVRTRQPIKAGEALTFFYPSTEWDMEQPFECSCHAASCLKTIKGAKYLTLEQLKRAYVAKHILRRFVEN